MENDKLFQVHMPEVDIRPGMEEIFEQARELASHDTILADGTHLRRVVIISPGRLLCLKDSYPPNTMPAELYHNLEKLLPPQPPLKIATIAYTNLDALRTDMRRAIPFIDYLFGFAYLGHAVWIFEGHASVLELGCKGAYYVLIYQRMLPFLDADWEKIIKENAGVTNIRVLSIKENK